MNVRRRPTLALIASLCLAVSIAGLSLRPAAADPAQPGTATPTSPETKTPSTTPPAAPAPATPDAKAPATATPTSPAPTGDAKPPAADAKPPAADAKPPAAEAKPPAAEAKPPVPDTKPPSDTKPPGAEVKPPAGADKPGAMPPADGKPHDTEIEPNGSPGVPTNATTESVDVPSRPVVMVGGQSSYDEAFKSIKASIDTVKAAMAKAGLKPTGHPVTIFSEPDDKGFKYKAAVPIAAPSDKPDLGASVSIGQSPSGRAIKFQHRGAYEDIDSTYDVITAYLDAKGLQVDNPYIEEYLTDLTTPDDPNLQVDIYVFVKK